MGNGSASAFIPAASDSTLKNGYIGNLLGFRLYQTENTLDGDANGVADSGDFDVFVAGSGTEAVTLARQITKISTYEPEDLFGEAVKGLYVYGALAVQPKRIFYFKVRRS